MDDTTVVVYEPKSNHDGVGGNFLYADGHVEFVRVPEYDEIIRSTEQHAR
jgi:prepilin-type processing-associated H-X9-DG protein